MSLSLLSVFSPHGETLGVSMIRHARIKVQRPMQRPWLLSSWPLLTSSRRACWSTRNASNEEGTKSPLFHPQKKESSPKWFLGGSGFWGKLRKFGVSINSERLDFHICSVFRPLGEASWQEHQQAVEEEFGPENFVVVVRGLLDEAREVVDF